MRQLGLTGNGESILIATQDEVARFISVLDPLTFQTTPARQPRTVPAPRKVTLRPERKLSRSQMREIQARVWGNSGIPHRNGRAVAFHAE